MSLPDYHSITEIPGVGATEEQIERLVHRYRFALKYAIGKRVLEVACGSGLGMEFMKDKALQIVGGDIDPANISQVVALHGAAGVLLTRMDAHYLPFRKQVFDVVLLFESLYYLEQPKEFIREVMRILDDQGRLIISTVNKNWLDFHPSPFTYSYFSVPELFELLKGTFQEVQIFGAFPVQRNSLKDRSVSLIKRIAVNLHLIPGSLTARSYLKRLFIGPLQPLPASINKIAVPYLPPDRIVPDAINEKFKIIYAVAAKGSAVAETGI